MKDTSEALFRADKQLLRFLTAGSVDDGKSTLIGRLLYEAGGVCEDQLVSVQRASGNSEHLNGSPDLSLITDGLKAEREQAITIDVAYRYFSTSRRGFIVADCPGHLQYTRNMVTGASTADVALLLVDARKGLLEQTRRHVYIARLLGIRNIIVVVNKMDLVNFDVLAFDSIRDQFTHCVPALLKDAAFYYVPISALQGDNVVQQSARMAWYKGPSVLNLLEHISVEEHDNDVDFRFPIQAVIPKSGVKFAVFVQISRKIRGLL